MTLTPPTKFFLNQNLSQKGRWKVYSSSVPWMTVMLSKLPSICFPYFKSKTRTRLSKYLRSVDAWRGSSPLLHHFTTQCVRPNALLLCPHCSAFGGGEILIYSSSFTIQVCWSISQSYYPPPPKLHGFKAEGKTNNNNRQHDFSL